MAEPATEVVTPNIGRRTGAALIRSSLLSMLAIAALGVTRLVHSALIGRSVPAGDPTFALVGTLIGVTMTAGLFLPGGLASAASKFISYHLGRDDLATARAVYRVLSWAGYATGVLLGAAVYAGSRLLGVGSRTRCPSASSRSSSRSTTCRSRRSTASIALPSTCGWS